jgi:hypothetical protein
MVTTAQCWALWDHQVVMEEADAKPLPHLEALGLSTPARRDFAAMAGPVHRGAWARVTLGRF